MDELNDDKKPEKVKYRKGRHPNTLKNLKPAKPGEVRNPKGIGQPPHLRALRKFTHDYLMDIIDVALTGNVEQLKEIAEDPKTPAIQVGVARVLYNAIKDGDWTRIEHILVRILGKVPEKIDTTSNGQTVGNTPFVVTFVKPDAEHK